MSSPQVPTPHPHARTAPAGLLRWTTSLTRRARRRRFSIIGQVIWHTDPAFQQQRGGQLPGPIGYLRCHFTVLALEAGAIASSTRTGWTVLAIGRSRLLHGTGGLDGFDDPARAPWSDVPGARYLVIDIGRLSGPRLLCSVLQAITAEAHGHPAASNQRLRLFGTAEEDAQDQ